MLTNKKYKSDKFLKPLMYALAVSTLVAYYSSHKTIVIVLLTLIATCIFGITVFRSIREKKNQDAVVNLLCLIAFYTLLFGGIKFLHLKL